MAQLVIISALWGEVSSFTTRALHRPDTGYERHYEDFYARTRHRLDSWKAMLPSDLQYNSQNFERSIGEGYSGIFISLHALFHATVIRLNRHVRIHALSADRMRRNIQQSFQAASSFSSIIHSLTAGNCQGRLASHPASRFLFSTPFPGYTLLLSIDVLSSAGKIAALPSCIDEFGTTVSFLDTMSTFWASAGVQKRAIAGRLQQLGDVMRMEEQSVQNGTVGQFWRVPGSLDTAFGENDAVCKADDQTLFTSLREMN